MISVTPSAALERGSATDLRLLGPGGGGVEVWSDVGDVMVVAPASPLGRALLGRALLGRVAGDAVRIPSGAQLRVARVE